MPSTLLEAALRAGNRKKFKQAPSQPGMVPGVLYGKDIKNESVAVDPKEVTSILTSDSGQNTIFKLKMGKTKVDVLIKDYLLDPVKGSLKHIDFLAVNLEDVMVFQVPVYLEGEATGVKDFGGVLDTILREIEVECKASDVPENILIDITSLGLNEQVRIKDLKVSEGIRILSDQEQVVLNLAPPAVAEEAEDEETEDLGLEGEESAEPEVLKKGKGDEAEEN